MPPLVLLATAALKRITPLPAADYGTKPDALPSRVLPWWDRLRLQWRGGIDVAAGGGLIKVAMGLHPDASEQDHLLASFDSLRLAVAPGGVLNFCFSSFEASAIPHPAAVGRPWMQFLGSLPLASIPEFEVSFRNTFTVPGSGDQDDHYLGWRAFKEGGPAPEEAPPQGPVDVVEACRSLGLEIELEIHLRGTTLGSNSGPSSPPTLYFGERQVLWFRQWLGAMRGAPSYISQASRMKRFGAPKRPRDETAKSLPRLLRRLHLEVLAPGRFEVKFFANNSTDPCARLRAFAGSARYGFKMEKAPPSAPADVPSSPHVWRVNDMEVEFAETVFAVSAQDGKAEEYNSNSPNLQIPKQGSVFKDSVVHSLLALHSSSPCTTPSSIGRGLERGEEALLHVGAATLCRHGNQSSAGKPASSLMKVLLRDARIYITPETRDAAVSAVDQVIGAFGKLPSVAAAEPSLGDLITPTSSLNNFSHLDDLSLAGSDNGGAGSKVVDDTLLSCLQSGDSNRGAECSTPCTADKGQLRHEVDLLRFQVMVYSKDQEGQFLIATDHARLENRSMPVPPGSNASTRDLAIFIMDAMQGYIIQTDIDPTARRGWLMEQDGRLTPPKSSLARRAFEPARVELHVDRLFPEGGGVPLDSQVRLRATALEVSLNTREFGILTNCVSCVAMAPSPASSSLTSRERNLGGASSTGMKVSSSIASRRTRVVRLRQRLAAFRMAVHTLASVKGFTPDAGALQAIHCFDANRTSVKHMFLDIAQSLSLLEQASSISNIHRTVRDYSRAVLSVGGLYRMQALCLVRHVTGRTILETGQWIGLRCPVMEVAGVYESF